LPVTGIAAPARSASRQARRIHRDGAELEQDRRRHPDAQLRQPARIRVRLGRALQVHQHHDEQIQHDDAAGVDQGIWIAARNCAPSST
jgi:hypothetical protein